MDRIGLIRASALAPAITLLRRRGVAVEQFLARAGLPAWAIDDPERLIPTSVLARLLAHAARADRLETFGLLAGQAAGIETLGTYGRLVRRCRTLGDALDATVRNHPAFSSNGRMWLVRRGNEVLLCQAFTARYDREWQQASHYVLMLMLSIVRLAAGSTWRPAEVSFQTGEASAVRAVDALSAARVAFAQPSTAIVFPKGLLREPLKPPMLDIEISRETIEAWRASAPPMTFTESVGQVVEMLSWQGYPDIVVTADILGMSVRTLQRHLAAVGLTHESLVGRARFATAVSLLEETDTKILDIALDLGYSDHAHFTRAFHRWAGCSPQEFRRRCAERRDRSTPAGT
jgi:AraC-like DNA-binding protein